MPVRTIPADGAMSDPKLYHLVAFVPIGMAVVSGLIAVIFMTNREMEGSVFPLLCIAAGFLIWGIKLFKKGTRLMANPLISRPISFNWKFPDKSKITVVIDVQFPPSFLPEQKDGVHNNSTPPILQRFQSDISAALIKFFEITSSAETTSTAIEQAIAQSIDYIQDNTKMHTVKFDCSSIEREAPPPPAETQFDGPSIYA